MPSTTTIGPTVDRECGYCEGDGCQLCEGTGVNTMRVQPFVTLGAAMEQIQAIRTSMGLRRTGTYSPKIGTPAYHVDAAEDYIASLFQQLVVMLPEEHERTEGRMNASAAPSRGEDGQT